MDFRILFESKNCIRCYSYFIEILFLICCKVPFEWGFSKTLFAIFFSSLFKSLWKYNILFIFMRYRMGHKPNSSIFIHLIVFIEVPSILEISWLSKDSNLKISFWLRVGIILISWRMYDINSKFLRSAWFQRRIYQDEVFLV